MSFVPFGSTAIQVVSATPAAGVAMANGTPTFATWTAPNDGQLHWVQVYIEVHVTVAQTGGGVSMTATSPDGVTASPSVDAGGHAAGITTANLQRAVQAGSVVSVQQSSALTLGAAIIWVSIWGL